MPSPGIDRAAADVDVRTSSTGLESHSWEKGFGPTGSGPFDVTRMGTVQIFLCLRAFGMAIQPANDSITRHSDA